MYVIDISLIIIIIYLLNEIISLRYSSRRYNTVNIKAFNKLNTSFLDRPAPKNEDEMMLIIFEFIDRLFSIVRPRKLLYMAIDGVAPRAKMNQQRSRRFRAAKDTAEKSNEIKRLRAQIIANGGSVPPEQPNEERFDSNCITPVS